MECKDDADLIKCCTAMGVDGIRQMGSWDTQERHGGMVLARIWKDFVPRWCTGLEQMENERWRGITAKPD